ncbi:hypothetical protein FRB90_002636 [Tulasnella sp. 427]|nr:hypothetical protein FRB90_002636 [Tulasnella sp. 427]
MVMITSQLAAIIATGIAVSGASAAALPARNEARAQQQVRMSLDPPAAHQYSRRSVPVAPLPASVSTKSNGKTRKIKFGKPNKSSAVAVNVDAKVPIARVHARAQVEIGHDNDEGDGRKPPPAKPQSNAKAPSIAPNNGKTQSAPPNNGKAQSNQPSNNGSQSKPSAQPNPKPQSKPQSQAQKPQQQAQKPNSDPQNPKSKPGTQPQNQSQSQRQKPKVNAPKQGSDNGYIDAGTHADDPQKGNVDGAVGMNKRDQKHHHHHHHHHHNGKRDDHVHSHEHTHDSHHHHHHGHHDVHKHVYKHSSRSVAEGQAPRSLLGRSFNNPSVRRGPDPRKTETQKAKRAFIRVGAPAYYYDDSTDGSLLHIGIGKRAPATQATVSANLQAGSSSAKPNAHSGAHLSSAGSATSGGFKKRGLFGARGGKPVGDALKYLTTLAGRDDQSEHQRRDNQAGVEGVINIVSAVAGSSTGEKIASLLLSSDPAANNAFVLNASNSSATHVFLVPTNSTSAAAAPNDGSIPVALHVPVYSPDAASMLDYCMTYDPNPPAPSPLTAQGCTDQVRDHQSQIFAYNPSSGVIVPMWTVSPSSTDPSASEDAVTSSAAPTSSASSTASSASATSSAAPSKRSGSPTDPSAASQSDVPDCDDTDSVEAASAGNSTMTPQDVTLIFTPSNAAGILPSSSAIAKDITTFFPPGSAPSDDGNVGASSAADSATDASDDDEDGQDDGEDDEDDEDPTLSPSSVDPTSQQPTSTDPTAAEFDGASEGNLPAAAVASLDGTADAEETVNDEEILPTPSGNSSPSMTPVPEASTPYSWMFTPQK